MRKERVGKNSCLELNQCQQMLQYMPVTFPNLARLNVDCTDWLCKEHERADLRNYLFSLPLQKLQKLDFDFTTWTRNTLQGTWNIMVNPAYDEVESELDEDLEGSDSE